MFKSLSDKITKIEPKLNFYDPTVSAKFGKITKIRIHGQT